MTREEMNKVTDARISALCPVCVMSGFHSLVGMLDAAGWPSLIFRGRDLLDLCVVSAVKHLGPA